LQTVNTPCDPSHQNSFGNCELPREIQELADKQYELFREDPFHPSLQVKQVGEMWTVRVGRSHRAITCRDADAFYWVWIGSTTKAAVAGRPKNRKAS